MKTAIVCIAYNRVKSLERLLKSLELADYKGDEIPLIISIDKSNTNEVENYADDYKWPYGPKKVKKHDENLGLQKHILSQGEEFKSFDALIILEDDVIVSPAFYEYVLQTTSNYYDNPEIAGISLYSFPLNYLTNLPFEPVKNEFDVFFMNTAQSWGQVWMKNQWKDFFDWYSINTEFEKSSAVPRIMYQWHKSWLKYHTRYCIEKNKYFVYPYHAFSSNCGAVGEHATNAYNNFQTSMQIKLSGSMKLPIRVKEGVLYDAFFENKKLYDFLKLSADNCCLDLTGYKFKPTDKRYLLSTQLLPFAVIKSFGLSLRPIEINVLSNNPGSDIFLYDTYKKADNIVQRHTEELLCYYFRINNLLWFIRRIGMSSIIKQVKRAILRKIRLTET